MSQNKIKIENGETKVNFASVDNINVFRFISEIYEVKGIPVWSFTKVEDIRDKLKKQWATLFLQYLTNIKNIALQKRLENPINTIESSIKQMNILVEKLAEKIIDDTEDNKVIKQRQLVENVSMTIANSFEFCLLNKEQDIRKYVEFFVEKLFDAVEKDLLLCGLSDDGSELSLFDSHFEFDGVILVSYNDYFCYSAENLKNAIAFKAEIVDRLMETDCLAKMKLI